MAQISVFCKPSVQQKSITILLSKGNIIFFFMNQKFNILPTHPHQHFWTWSNLELLVYKFRHVAVKGYKQVELAQAFARLFVGPQDKKKHPTVIIIGDFCTI